MSEQTHDAAWPNTGPPAAEAPCAQPAEAERGAFLNGLKTQIRNGVYQPDIRDLARSLANMIVRGA